MPAYYNEIDPFNVEWLKNLIAAGHIAPGDVDDRSIEDVRPDDLKPYTQCHFFAGIGVWSYALRQAGWPDDSPVWTGSCPCQPFSTAGSRAKFNDERHLWPAWFQLIVQRQPSVIFGEQVASKDGLGWLDLVQTDLENAQYAAGAFDLCAAGVGAPHLRQRLWFVACRMADANCARLPESIGGRELPAEKNFKQQGKISKRNNDSFWSESDWIYCGDNKIRPIEPGTFPLVDGATARVGRLRAYGNAICAPTATAFIEAAIDEII